MNKIELYYEIDFESFRMIFENSNITMHNNSGYFIDGFSKNMMLEYIKEAKLLKPLILEFYE